MVADGREFFSFSGAQLHLPSARAYSGALYMIVGLWGSGSLFEAGVLEDILEFLIEGGLDLAEVLMKLLEGLFLRTAF